MKRALLLLVLALPLHAQCESELRNTLYREYYNSRTGDAAAQKHAYGVAQDYLKKYAEQCPDKYTESVQKFVKAYEDATDRSELMTGAFTTNGDPVKAFDAGHRILARTPDDLQTLIALTVAGDTAHTAKNDAFVVEALGDAKKAVELIGGGKAPAAWKPYKNREDALDALYYHAGNLSLANHDPVGAVTWLIKAATEEGAFKNEPLTYGRLGAAYQAGQLETMQKDYNEKFGGKNESPEGKHALEQINQVVDRVLDAYARAVVLSGDKANYAAAKTAWQQAVMEFYKFRVNDTMKGYDEWLAAAMTRPLPAPYEPKPYVAPPPPVKKKRH